MAARVSSATSTTGANPKVKAVGGSGGRGGDVVVRTDAGVSTLLAYKHNPHHSADAGTHGGGDYQQGRRGADAVLPVPVGTTIRDDDGIVVADLVETGQSVVLVEGGRGGRGNAALVSAARRTPTFCEQGEYGQAVWVRVRASARGRRGPHRLPERGKVDSHLTDLGRETQDRRLPVHNPRAEPRCGIGRRARVRRCGHPWAHRRGGGRPRAGPRIPASHRACASTRCVARPVTTPGGRGRSSV